jgi:hypothetical protein
MDSFIIIEFYLVHIKILINLFDDLSSLNLFNKVYSRVCKIKNGK